MADGGKNGQEETERPTSALAAYLSASQSPHEYQSGVADGHA